MDLESNISLENVINKINQLGKENDKNDFIKNYQELKSKISIIDDILENKNDFVSLPITNHGFLGVAYLPVSQSY